jgi:hypothetical protein
VGNGARPADIPRGGNGPAYSGPPTPASESIMSKGMEKKKEKKKAPAKTPLEKRADKKEKKEERDKR